MTGVAGALAAALGCASRPAPDARAPAAAAAPAGPLFQADGAPIGALAYAAPYLWIGSARGLRRIRLPEREAEWVGAAAGLTGRRVSALASDGDGGVWVATESGVGRLPPPGRGPFRHRPVALLTNVTQLLPVTSAAGDQAWVGTPGGLFFIDAGRATAVAGAARLAAITSLDVADDDRGPRRGGAAAGGAGAGVADGSSVWVGVRGRGLLRMDARGVRASFGPPEGLDFVEAVGTARLPNGTRFAAGRSADGRTRFLLLQSAGPVLLEAQPEVAVTAVIAGPDGPLLLAGPPGAQRLYGVANVERGEVVGGGGFRLSPVKKTLQGMRLAATPDGRPAPPEITVAAAGGDEIYVGTRARGVARVGAAAARRGHDDDDEGGGARALRVPDYLPAGEAALDARALSVACLERDRCLVTTANGSAWTFDGRSLAPLAAPAEIGGTMMAIGGDGSGPVFGVFAAPDGKTIAVARMAADGGGRWEPLQRLAIPGEGAAVAASATPSPDGALWIAVRDHLASGQELGRGVVELALPSGKAVHHRGYTAREQRPPEALPVPGEVAAVRFEPGAGAAPAAKWLCTSVGVLRFAGGNLRHWGEDEGLESERCADLLLEGGGVVWLASAAGPARFDGKWWRYDAAAGWPRSEEGEAMAVRALADCGSGPLAGTAHGVWSLVGASAPAARPARKPPRAAGDSAAPATAAVATSRQVLGSGAGLVDEDVQDLACDRFGRLWVLGRLGLTLAQAP